MDVIRCDLHQIIVLLPTAVVLFQKLAQSRKTLKSRTIPHVLLAPINIHWLITTKPCLKMQRLQHNMHSDTSRERVIAVYSE